MGVVQTTNSLMSNRIAPISLTPSCGEIADSEFDKQFLEAIKVLSNHHIYRVPIRRKGITSGKAKRCYWNASVISQTWGGEVIYGYIVDVLDEKWNLGGTIRLLGHGIWKNPEGKLVDVTDEHPESFEPNRTHRYFLPVDKKLVLNGVASEQLANLVYVASEISIGVDMKCKVADHNSDLKKVFNYDGNNVDPFMTVEWGNTLTPSELFKGLKGKIVFTDAWPSGFVRDIMNRYAKQTTVYAIDKDKECKEKYGKSFWEEFGRVMNPVIIELGDCEGNVPLKVNDNRQGFTGVFWDNFYKAIKERTTVLELVGDLNICDTIYDGDDATWDSKMLGDESTVVGLSTCTGKSIQDYSPRSLENVSLPKKKSKKRKVEKTAKKYGMTVEQVMVLSDPYLWPHPNLIKETGLSEGAFKQFSRV